MKSVQRGGIAILGCLLAIQAAWAGPFGDKFKRWVLGPEAQGSAVNGYEFDLDRTARGCMQCHDGSRAAHVVLKSADTPMQFSPDGVQSNHPVGMNYDRYASAKAQDYVPGSALDPNIDLVDGQVTCISCHRLKNAETASLVDPPAGLVRAGWIESPSTESDSEDCSASGELTVGPRQTDLCLACHRK